MKKILLPLLLLVALGAGYVYYTSLQKPTDVPVANLPVTGDVMTGDLQITSGSVSGDFETASGSYIVWKATKPTWYHTGKVFLTEGNVSIVSGVITSGSFNLDMTSITLDDIDNAKLLGDIKNAIFSVSTYPTSQFVITTVSSSATGYTVQGNLTIAGQTHPIAFPATLTTRDDETRLQAAFAIDRLVRWLNAFQGVANDYIEYTVDLIFSPVVSLPTDVLTGTASTWSMSTGIAN